MDSREIQKDLKAEHGSVSDMSMNSRCGVPGQEATRRVVDVVSGWEGHVCSGGHCSPAPKGQCLSKDVGTTLTCVPPPAVVFG